MASVRNAIIDVQSHDHFTPSHILTKTEVFTDGARSFSVSVHSVPDLRPVRAAMLDQPFLSDIIAMISGRYS